MTLYRVTESFPFDSSKPTKFDDYGRPILDRAVSSRTMRDSFAKIFSDGVFGKPADAFVISKGEGLSVKINPGMCVIDGAMGGWREEQTFAFPAATGKVAYGVFLRLDDNSDMRSIYVRIDAGAAGSSPVPPEPESGDKVTELRLGYVVVPSGATDLSGATVTNEKGLEVCPYTAPFAEIDLAEIIHDAQVYADERNAEFTAYLVDSMEFIASCLDGTVAGNLQSQIDDLRAAAFSADNVDPRNLEIEADTPTGTKLLRISDNFVDGTLAKIDAETRKLMLQVQAIRAAMGLGDSLGVLQPEYGGTGGLLQPTYGGTGLTSLLALADKLIEINASNPSLFTVESWTVTNKIAGDTVGYSGTGNVSGTFTLPPGKHIVYEFWAEGYPQSTSAQFSYSATLYLDSSSGTQIGSLYPSSYSQTGKLTKALSFEVNVPQGTTREIYYSLQTSYRDQYGTWVFKSLKGGCKIKRIPDYDLPA